MKAQTFKIVGDIRFFPQMKEDIIQLGYKLHSNSYNGKFIVTNVSQVEGSTKEEFKVLYQTDYNDKTKTEIFNLPEDYNKALDFAKEQLLDKYWVEEFKADDVIFDSTHNKACKIKYVDNNYHVKSKDGNEYYLGKFEARKATPAEIEEYNRKEFKIDDIIITNQNVAFKLVSGRVDSSVGWVYNGKRKDGLIIPIIENTFRLATPQEIEEFNKPVYKAGDYIYQKKDDIYSKTGEMAIIEKNSQGNLMLNFLNPKFKDYNTNLYDSYMTEYWRLATPEEIKKANEPKDGDIVVRTRDDSNKGQIGKFKITNLKFYSFWEVWDKNDKMTHGTFNTNHIATDFWRKATKEEIAEWNTPSWKDGDIVVLIDADSSIKDGTTVKIGEVFGDGSILFRDKEGKVGGCKKNPVIRLANAEEVDKFNKKDYVEMTVGSRNAKIRVYKDKIHLLDKRAALSLLSLEKAYINFIACSNIGDYSIQFSSNAHDYQGYLIGCSSENNLVSLNEIKAVINAAESL